MSAPLFIPRASSHQRWIRRTAAVAGVAAIIAAGGYAATNSFGPDAHEAPPPVTSEYVSPSAPALEALQRSVAGQYGSGR